MEGGCPHFGDVLFLTALAKPAGVKLLRWDGDRLSPVLQRLEGGSFELPTFGYIGNYEISSSDFCLFILNGVSLKLVRLRKWNMI